MPSKRLIQACATLLLIAVACAPLGCKVKSAADASPGAASVVTSGSLNASGSAEGSAAASTSGSAGSSAGKSSGGKLTSSDAAALDAELAAIQRELDKMSVPSDSDFGGIESGLK